MKTISQGNASSPSKDQPIPASKQTELPSVKVSKHGSIQAPAFGAAWVSLLAKAEGALSPSLNNAAVIHDFVNSTTGAIDATATFVTLQDQIAAFIQGDMDQVEATLFAQAASLQSIYVKLSTRALAQQGLAQFQVFMGMALKAQSQCRTTLEALNEIKFPKAATFVKQANIANNQQVNNGVQSPAEKICDSSNELLTEENHETLDLGGAQKTGQPDPALAAMGKSHRAQDRHRQKAERAKRLKTRDAVRKPIG